MEQIAQAIHDGWWEYQLDRGINLGPRNEIMSRHPHMLPWSALDDEAKNQDRFIASLVIAEYMASDSFTCETLHEAWRVWEKLHGGKHPHDKPYKAAHASKDQTFRKNVRIDEREHAKQLRHIQKVLEKWKKDEQRD